MFLVEGWDVALGEVGRKFPHLKRVGAVAPWLGILPFGLGLGILSKDRWRY